MCYFSFLLIRIKTFELMKTTSITVAFVCVSFSFFLSFFFCISTCSARLYDEQMYSFSSVCIRFLYAVTVNRTQIFAHSLQTSNGCFVLFPCFFSFFSTSFVVVVVLLRFRRCWSRIEAERMPGRVYQPICYTFTLSTVSKYILLLLDAGASTCDKYKHSNSQRDSFNTYMAKADKWYE